MNNVKHQAIFIFIICIFIGAFVNDPVNVRAYETQLYWPWTFTLEYTAETSLDNELGIAGTQTIIDGAASQWYNAGFVNFVRGGVDSRIWIRAQNFATQQPSCFILPVTDPGSTCYFTDGNTKSLVNALIYLNSSSSYVWNKTGIMDKNSNPKKLIF